jgi:hypothetical protein
MNILASRTVIRYGGEWLVVIRFFDLGTSDAMADGTGERTALCPSETLC